MKRLINDQTWVVNQKLTSYFDIVPDELIIIFFQYLFNSDPFSKLSNRYQSLYNKFKYNVKKGFYDIKELSFIRRGGNDTIDYFIRVIDNIVDDIKYGKNRVII